MPSFERRDEEPNGGRLTRASTWLAIGLTAFALGSQGPAAAPARAAILMTAPKPGAPAPGGGLRTPDLPRAGLEAPAIPPEKRPFVEHATVLEVAGRPYTLVKLAYDEKTFEELAFDADGKSYPADEIRKQLLAGFASFGKVHPTLRRLLDASPTPARSVLLWLDLAPPVRVERPLDLDSASEKAVVAALEEAHAKSLRAFTAEKDAALGKLRLASGELTADRPGSPFVVARLSPRRIAELAESPALRMLLLHDPKGLDDLADALEVAGADDVIASGISGDGVDVAVWENCPDDVSDLDIAGSFSSDEGLACNPRQHSRHVTGIIRNTTDTSGFAPAATMFSADSTNLAALDWAIDEQRVSAVNQSFHRAAEIGDGLQADDLYKDYKVLHYPWPTIVQAAGNWCASGTSCFEGGSDVRDEFVNHKGFNTINAGNHDDTAAQMSASSCFVNPTSPHGDRELPEISANGTGVDAVGLTLSGTSMASPAVVGSVALLQEARSVLRYWPEANRALLFAGAERNIATHAGQASGGGPAADAPNTWWRDVSLGNDGFDGAGALDVERSREIARFRWAGKALSRGFDIGRYRPTSFDASGFAKRTYQVSIPRSAAAVHVKVALAWNSEATIEETEPEEIYASSLGMDLDIRVYDANGQRVAVSQSWDNSYEIAEFDGVPGATYTIKVKRWSARPGAESWFGIAWDRQ